MRTFMKFFKTASAFFSCALLLAEEPATQAKVPSLEEHREWHAKRKARIEEEQCNETRAPKEKALMEKYAIRLYKLKTSLVDLRFVAENEEDLLALMQEHAVLFDAVRDEIKALPAEYVEFLANWEAVENRMKSIIIPVVLFRDVKIEDAVLFFNEASREYDNPKLPLENRGIKFVLDLSSPVDAHGKENEDDNVRAINFGIVRYENLHTVVNRVLDCAGLQYTIRGNTVIIHNHPDD